MKTPKILLLIFCCSLIMFPCCSGGEDDDPDDQDVETGPPVETNSPNTNYAPAFTGQTRIGSVKTTTVIRSNILTSALSAPWGITSLPDGRLLITQKGGQMRIVTAAGSVGVSITGFLLLIHPVREDCLAYASILNSLLTEWSIGFFQRMSQEEH
jgi:glucose/arabinose dehydrogenase